MVLELIIGYTLLICVIMALSLEVLGLILYISSSNNIYIDLDRSLVVKEENFFIYSLNTISSAVKGPNYFNLMSLGLAVLMFTPYLRAVLSVVYFSLAKNYKYTLLTLFVTIVITASLIIH